MSRGPQPVDPSVASTKTRARAFEGSPRIRAPSFLRDRAGSAGASIHPDNVRRNVLYRNVLYRNVAADGGDRGAPRPRSAYHEDPWRNSSIKLTNFGGLRARWRSRPW